LLGASRSIPGAPPLITAREVLELGTRGGAAVLGREDIGSLEVGKCADFFAVNLNRLDYAGALHDPLAAVVFCAPQAVDYTVVHGSLVVDSGQLCTVDVPALVEKHNTAARRLLNSN
jgi:cytosine/adenosine deaminase-related metal-dependent hydrolase